MAAQSSYSFVSWSFWSTSKHWPIFGRLICLGCLHMATTTLARFQLLLIWHHLISTIIFLLIPALLKYLPHLSNHIYLMPLIAPLLSLQTCCLLTSSWNRWQSLHRKLRALVCLPSLKAKRWQPMNTQRLPRVPSVKLCRLIPLSLIRSVDTNLALQTITPPILTFSSSWPAKCSHLEVLAGSKLRKNSMMKQQVPIALSVLCNCLSWKWNRYI